MSEVPNPHGGGGERGGTPGWQSQQRWEASSPQWNGVPTTPVSGQPGMVEPPTQPINVVPPLANSPVTGPPFGAGPAGVLPQQPVSAAPDPLFPDEAPSWQPRIVPSPPPQRGKLLTGLLIGLLAGLLAFGGSGFLVGRVTAEPDGPGPNKPVASASPSLRPYEQSQLTLNKTKFSGELATFAEPWLSAVSVCESNKDRGGPKLNRGEEARVLCKHGSMSVYFVQYTSTSERDKVRIRNLGQNVDARELAPGAGQGQEGRPTPSGHSTGSYIEYAYRMGSGPSARTVSGVWWDDAGAPVGAYLLAFWEDGVNSSWEPMRDVWSRYA